MSQSLARFSWCYWSNKNNKEPVISSGSASDSTKLCSSSKKHANLSSSSLSSRSCSSKKVKKKWWSREARKGVVDKEYDVVLVPSDGVCLSASEESSYDSDWSIGWMEPHAPDFLDSDDEDADADDSFAVLVPCCRNDCKGFDMEEKVRDQLLNVVSSFPNGFPAGQQVHGAVACFSSEQPLICKSHC